MSEGQGEESRPRTALGGLLGREYGEIENKWRQVSNAEHERRFGEPIGPSLDAGIRRTRSDGNLRKRLQPYRSRFQDLEGLNKIETTIDYRTSLLDLTPDGHPYLLYRLGNLGVAYGTRFQFMGEIDDLENAIKYLHRALTKTPNDDPHFSHWLTLLGTAHYYRFGYLGEPSDIDKSNEYRSRALSSIQEDHPDVLRLLSEVGESYSAQFQRLGELHDLDGAIKHKSRLLDLTPEAGSGLSCQLADLGEHYISRYRRLDQLDDLKKGLEHQSRALKLAPDDDPDLSAALATSYIYLFQRLGKQEAFEKVIEHMSYALSQTNDDHPMLPTRLANLGSAYVCRFEHMKEPDDIRKAVEHICRAISLASDAEPELPCWHFNLALTYTRRFEHSGEIYDFEKVIEHHSRAIALTPDDEPELARRHYVLGKSFFDQYQRTGDPLQLNNSLDSFRRASDPSTGVSRTKFQCAILWASLASKHSCLNSSCIEAYRATVALLPHVIWLSDTPEQQDQDIALAKSTAKRAAAAAIRSLDYNLALEWLEHARCVVWSQNLMLRSPLDQLHSSHPDLAARLQEVAKRLQDSSHESPASSSKDRRHMAKQYNRLLVQARSLPGFEDFLRPMRANRLVRAAKNGPIVVINCYKDSCDALVILPGKDDIAHINLPNFSEEKAAHVYSELEESIQRYDSDKSEVEFLQELGTIDDISGVLLTLWNDIVKPVLDFLGYTKNPSTKLPHITWCPTGKLSLLPLHAAGDYGQPQTRVFDYVISSYTPTLTALLTSTPGSLSGNLRVLAIGHEDASGSRPLPGVIKELACVKAHMLNKVECEQLINDQATRTAVLDAMQEYDWVHFACHAHQNIDHPAKSGFRLHDGDLNLAAINQRSFTNKGLAFLSACETARGDERLPDEAMHLASGMLMAGYSSVIAMMWTVYDGDAQLISDKVYGWLMKDGKVGNGQAGEALHYAVAELREKVGEKEFMRWVPYIHIGS
ncbi:unnamed protein product [Rhizoctonia solani]|uniref:CHAT domain-containing protein n=1 Tax=Rhizoctonia solani TaxID=456999 RepID=A0A8H3HUW3_9AGAM|nr:unnamed protein product [Rhizoctonia solani]